MKNRNFTPVGALHPILFFAGVYVVALLLSIFICSSLFYSCNTGEARADILKQDPGQQKAVISQNTSLAALR